MTNDSLNQVIPMEPEGVQPGFDIVLRGYDRGQVDRQIGWLEEQLSASDRETATLTESLRRAENESAEAQQQAAKAAAELERGRPTFEALGERIGTILRLAEEEAAELRQAGAADAERSRTTLAEEVTAARRSMEEHQRAAEQQAATVVAAAREEAQRIITDARRSAAETTSAAQRQVAATTKQRDAIHNELLRVQERFAAVMGAAIDVSDQRGGATVSATGGDAEVTTVLQAGAPAGTGAGSDADPPTARTQPMPTE